MSRQAHMLNLQIIQIPGVRSPACRRPPFLAHRSLRLMGSLKDGTRAGVRLSSFSPIKAKSYMNHL